MKVQKSDLSTMLIGHPHPTLGSTTALLNLTCSGCRWPYDSQSFFARKLLSNDRDGPGTNCLPFW